MPGDKLRDKLRRLVKVMDNNLKKCMRKGMVENAPFDLKRKVVATLLKMGKGW